MRGALGLICAVSMLLLLAMLGLTGVGASLDRAWPLIPVLIFIAIATGGLSLIAPHDPDRRARR